ncbi:LuxR C-terminal-related transcriptional regulator [Nocardia sp. NPDC006630]|uniref:LuxR C-terminal-related transcriptional regulator n=1 Tax=Nocardia sp. NPDC006630 TaxID=3157181 RepID=UPI0033B88FA1
MSGFGTVQMYATGSFLGRRRELTRIGDLLDRNARLLTLIGPGGIGKTRLAARALVEAHRSLGLPVFWVSLAELPAGADIEDLVESATRVDSWAAERRDGMLTTVLSGDPAVRRILVMDNCEHVLDSARAVIARLIEGFPGLTIVATSREPIGWDDEYIVTVPPLSAGQSVELFCGRADLLERPIGNGSDQMAVVEQICRHVDNNPLFIRLAAARLRFHPPAMVLRELSGDPADKRLHWSRGQVVSADPRHRGVYDVIAWSFELCSAPEQLLLERMSIFAAGYVTGEQSLRNGAELDGVIAVCADERLPAAQIPALVERLAERSLVSMHLEPTTMRWYLVESVRVFACERLRRENPDDAARTVIRHRHYFRDKIVAGQYVWNKPQERTWLDGAQASWGDVLMCIESGLADPDEAVVSLEILATLLWMWVPFVTFGGTALMRVTDRVLEVTRRLDPPPSGLRTRAVAVMAWIALWEGRSAEAMRLLDQCVEVTRPSPLGAWREAGEDLVLVPAAEWLWGIELLLLHRDPRAIPALSRAYRKFAAVRDPVGEEVSAMLVAMAAAFIGTEAQALDHTERYTVRASAAGSTLSYGWALLARSVALAKHGRADEAMVMSYEVLEQHLLEGDMWAATWAVGARIAATTAQLAQQLVEGKTEAAQLNTAATRVARLIGALRVSHDAMGLVVDSIPLIVGEIQPAAMVAEAVLGAAAYAAAEAEGATVRPEFAELRRFGLNPEHESCAAVVVPSRWNALSPAESDVAMYAAAGWSNSAIARARHSSTRTVDAQLVSIRQKLVIASRTEIIRQVPAELADRVRTAAERRPDAPALRASRD